jgi:hypothetical protein
MKLDEVSATLCPVKISQRDVQSTNEEKNIVYQKTIVVF